MPVCSFFLRGVCGRDECPYLHVSVGRDAEVCPDFIKGYCPRGEKVTLLSSSIVVVQRISRKKRSHFVVDINFARMHHQFCVMQAEILTSSESTRVKMIYFLLQCTKQHTLDCPKFSLTGSCPDGAKCQLRHSRKPTREEV